MTLRIGSSKVSAFHSSDLPLDLRGFTFKTGENEDLPARKYFENVRNIVRKLDEILKSATDVEPIVCLRNAFLYDFAERADELTRRSFHGWRTGFVELVANLVPRRLLETSDSPAEVQPSLVTGANVEEVVKKVFNRFLERSLKLDWRDANIGSTKLPPGDGLEVVPTIIVVDREALISKLTVEERKLFEECYIRTVHPFQYQIKALLNLVKDPEKCKRLYKLVQGLSGANSEEVKSTIGKFGNLPVTLGSWKLTGRDGHWDAYAQVGVSGLAYGSSQWQVQQLTHYQDAVAVGALRRVTVELSGVLDVKVFSEIFGEGLERPGAVPNIEFVYSLTLPSGSRYHLLLRGVPDFSQRKENSDATYTAEDRKVIEALRNYLDQSDHRRTLEIFGVPNDSDGAEFSSFTLESRMYDLQAGPSSLEKSWCRLIVARLAGQKSELTELPSDLDWRRPEFADYSHFEAAVRNRLPALAAAYPVKDPDRYVLKDEELEPFIQRHLPGLFDRCASERQRIAQASHESQTQLGYAGPIGGVPIRLDFLLMDKIITFKTGKRDYGDRRGILPISDLPKILEKVHQSRKVQLIINRPSVDGTLDRRDVWLEPSKVEEYYKEVVAKACRELRKLVPDWKSWAEEALGHHAIDREEHQTAQVCEGVIKKLYREIAAKQKSLERIDTSARIQARKLAARHYGETEASSSDGRAQLERMRETHQAERAAVLDVIWRCQTSIIDIFNSMFPGIVNASCEFPSTVIDHNYVKLIFTVLPNAEVLISEEKVSATSISRPTHSQHTQGGCMLLGGEIFLARGKFCFADVGEWIRYHARDLSNPTSSGSAEYICWEVNNASGHGRPPPSTLALVDRLITPRLREMGIDVSRLRVVDRLAPGMQLPSLERF